MRTHTDKNQEFSNDNKKVGQISVSVWVLTLFFPSHSDFTGVKFQTFFPEALRRKMPRIEGAKKNLVPNEESSV